MLFPTLKKKFGVKKNYSGGGGGGVEFFFLEKRFFLILMFYAIFNITKILKSAPSLTG